VGPWPFPRVAGQDGSITNKQDQLKVPSYPFHYTLTEFSPDVPDNKANSPRLTAGRTNTAFMDGHAAPVRRWEGTKHPLFP
jgi:prepilin-type processing-associated H-X9-DG protein